MPARAGDATPAKQLFGAVTLPSDTASQVVGFYSKGCLSGGMAIPTDGPTWQAMRLSRNRRWGHPQLIETIEKLSRDAASKDGWHGLLIGDMSQPRGGPMISGHASHQVGLDADIWLTQMPGRRFSPDERETVSAISVLKPNSVEIDPKVWSNSHARLIMRAASYPEVQRILVHPAIKKQLCETWKGDRSHLNKVRPYYGHYYHMHLRIRCPGDSPACKAQNAVPADDGCGAPLKWWFDVALKPKKPEKPSTKPAKPKYTMLSDLPAACRTVLNAPGVSSVEAATRGPTGVAATAYAPEEPSYTPFSLPAMIPLPKPRPVMQ
jgi:penicillin-insensitive murein endopeptidase